MNNNRILVRKAQIAVDAKGQPMMLFGTGGDRRKVGVLGHLGGVLGAAAGALGPHRSLGGMLGGMQAGHMMGQQFGGAAGRGLGHIGRGAVRVGRPAARRLGHGPKPDEVKVDMRGLPRMVPLPEKEQVPLPARQPNVELPKPPVRVMPPVGPPSPPMQALFPPSEHGAKESTQQNIKNSNNVPPSQSDHKGGIHPSQVQSPTQTQQPVQVQQPMQPMQPDPLGAYMVEAKEAEERFPKTPEEQAAMQGQGA